MSMIFFTPTQLQSKLSKVFNAVQRHGAVIIGGRSRPEMVLMLRDSHDVMVQTAIDQKEKIRQLADLIKAQG